MSAGACVEGEGSESCLFSSDQRMEVTGAAGNGGEELLLDWYTVSIGMDEKSLQMNSSDSCTIAKAVSCCCVEYFNMVAAIKKIAGVLRARMIGAKNAQL